MAKPLQLDFEGIFNDFHCIYHLSFMAKKSDSEAVDSAQMSLEFPPRSDHTSGSGSLHSKVS